jgi:N-methylhydantoinase A
MRMQHFLEVRYAGQDFSLQVSFTPDRGSVRDAFHDLHQRRFGYHKADSALEIVNARLAATAPPALRALPKTPPCARPALLGRRAIIFEEDAIDCPMYWRESLPPGERIEGPGVIQEYASTTLLFPQDRAEVTRTGELLIHVGERR